MKNLVSILVLAALVALMVASGASAKKQLVRSNHRTAHKSLVKSARHSVDRRAGRNSF